MTTRYIDDINFRFEKLPRIYKNIYEFTVNSTYFQVVANNGFLFAYIAMQSRKFSITKPPTKQKV